MNINFYTNRPEKSGFMEQFSIELFDVLNNQTIHKSYQNIGIIDWWWCSDEQRVLNNIKQFVDSNDICFFVSEEIFNFGNHSYHYLNSVFSLLNDRNVYYVASSEEPELKITPNTQRTLQFPWFFKTYLDIDLGEYFKPDINFREKPYTFNMLLGSKKSFRTQLYEQLMHNERIYSTYMGHSIYKHDVKTNLDTPEIQNKLLHQDLEQHKLDTMVHVEGAKTELSHIVPTNIYAQSHFDIVSESNADLNMHFTTEKTGKPLATGRFFIYAGVNDVKSYLEKYGFDFTDYMFESYGNSVVNLINEISHNDNLIQDIYSKTKSARVHNMMNYNEHSKNFWSNLNGWLLECLNKSF